MTTRQIISALERAARANYKDPWRKGNVINLAAPGEVVMTGDLHGHERNFEKLVKLSQLERNPNRHLILHELLHGGEAQEGRECHSHLLLAKAAELKMKFPGQVHFLLGNHAAAQVCRDEVLKNGKPMVRALTAGVTSSLGDYANLVMGALDGFILSMPLAALTDNRIWMSHSLPGTVHLAEYDQGVFDRRLSLADLKTDRSLKALIWDRRHSEKSLTKLAQMWNVDMFIVGHQPQESGFCILHERLAILASDHNHGCFLKFELGRRYEPDGLFAGIKPLASVA